jgi:hypothetical protein
MNCLDLFGFDFLVCLLTTVPFSYIVFVEGVVHTCATMVDGAFGVAYQTVDCNVYLQPQ